MTARAVNAMLASGPWATHATRVARTGRPPYYACARVGLRTSGGAVPPLPHRWLHGSAKRSEKGEHPAKPDPPPETSVQKKSSLHELVDSSSSLFQNYPRSLRDLALKARSLGRSKTDGAALPAPERAPAAGRKPTKDELLQYARGFWTRLRIRFKWFTIRGFRRFNVDEIGAFFTLGGLGGALWVIVGTTTFVSVVFAALNLLNLQEYIALKLANYISKQTGFTVVCGSAIVPIWKEGRISFKDVVLTRRAQPIAPEALQHERQALDPEKPLYDRNNALAPLSEDIPAYDTGDEVVSPMGDEELARAEVKAADKNFSMFELRIDAVDVQLSVRRWLDGRGIIKTADVRGVRGVFDRRNVFWDPDMPYDPRKARRKARPGDFDLESFHVEDFLVTVYQPGDFRPFNVSIFEMQVPRLRAQWLFYDLLNADSSTGQIDGCLFSLHKPQSVQHTSHNLYGKHQGHYLQNWSRLRVDGVNIDHVQKMSGLSGPLTWIYSGRFDLVADIKFPREYDKDVDINTVITEILENLSATFAQGPKTRTNDEALIPGQPVLSGPAIYTPVVAVGPVAERAQQQRDQHENAAKRPSLLPWRGKADEAPAEAEPPLDLPLVEGGKEAQLIPPSVVIELDVRLKDIKASMPIFTRELSYALARPVVAFMNAHRTLIPVSCRIVMDLVGGCDLHQSEFDGALDLAQTGLLPLVSSKIYEALANHVSSLQANTQRVRNVSMWSLDLAAQGMLRTARKMRDTMQRIMPESAMP